MREELSRIRARVLATVVEHLDTAQRTQPHLHRPLIAEVCYWLAQLACDTTAEAMLQAPPERWPVVEQTLAQAERHFAEEIHALRETLQQVAAQEGEDAVVAHVRTFVTGQGP